MPSWKFASNGLWLNAANWNGGIPNAAGAVADFTIASAGSSTMIVFFEQNALVSVGTLNILTDSNDGWQFQGDGGVTDAILRFQGSGGGPAFINVDTNGSGRESVISGLNGLRVSLATDVILTTTDIDTTFRIAAPMSGLADLYKFGNGTLQLGGNNTAWFGDLNLFGGRFETDNANSVANANIELDNDALLVTTGSLTLANRIEVGPGVSAGTIAADGATSLTLSGQMVVASEALSAVRFGTATENGHIVLSGTSVVTGSGGFQIGGGIVHFGSADAAANYFSSLSATGLLQVVGQLDTAGLVAKVDNLDMDGGAILSGIGPLDLTVEDSTNGTNVQDGLIQGTAFTDKLVFNVATHFEFAAVSFLDWTAGTDTITINGSQAGNNLTGSAVNDIINGNGGNDTLRGGFGADLLVGSTGNDTYRLDDALDTLVENAGEGSFDTVEILDGPTSFTLAANFENLTFFTNTDNTGIGNAVVNIINGGGGADTLDGKAGADTMDGHGGDDFFFVDNALDKVFEAFSEGNDRVFAGVSFALNGEAEVEMLTTTNSAGVGAINLTGSEYANTIVGNAGTNMLDGNKGADTMFGLGGDDFFFVDDALDKASESAGQGNDRVFAGVSWALAAGSSVETISTVSNVATTAINLTGNEIANTIVGNAGANTLNGGGGADLLSGLGGDDFYFVDNAADRAAESASQGNDRVFASASWVLNAGDSVEMISTTNNAGVAAINLTGNELAQTISGNDGVNILDGKGGADTLAGRAGADTFAFTTVLGATNVDRITDFQSEVDKIAVDNAVFTTVGANGALNANAFVVGSAAADASDRIVYDQATGQLFYDADGNGGTAAVLFATLDASPMLTAGDFTVI